MARRVLASLGCVVALAACSKPHKTGPEETPTVATAPTASASALGFAPADSFDGLGVTGVGEGAGIPGEGIGFGTDGSTGHGEHRAKRPPDVRMGALRSGGGLAPLVIQRVVRQNFGRFHACYQDALKFEPTLEGIITVSFTIQNDGAVSGARSVGSITDASLTECVKRAFSAMSFPRPAAGAVDVTAPIAFSSGERASINGKLLSDVGADDVKAALEKAGCTEVTRQENPPGVTSPTVFAAKKDGTLVTVTFVASFEPGLPEAGISKLRDAGAVVQQFRFLLAIRFDSDPDGSAAKALMHLLVVN